jgi:hypothetical protein
MRRLTTLAAAWLTVVPGVAGAAEPPCLTPAEFTSLAGYAMPSIISGTSQRCAPTLGPDAFLRRGGQDLAARYARQKPSHWPGAKAAFLKFSSTLDSGIGGQFRNMADAPLQGILEGMVAGIVSQQIPLERCGAIDKVVRLLSPLPSENTAELIAVATGLISQSGRPKLGKINICPS